MLCTVHFFADINILDRNKVIKIWNQKSLTK